MMNKAILDEAVAKLRDAATTGQHAGSWSFTPAVLVVLAELDRLATQEQIRNINMKRERERRAKETPEQAAARREKNRLRMAAKRAAKK